MAEIRGDEAEIAKGPFGIHRLDLAVSEDLSRRLHNPAHSDLKAPGGGQAAQSVSLRLRMGWGSGNIPALKLAECLTNGACESMTDTLSRPMIERAAGPGFDSLIPGALQYVFDVNAVAGGLQLPAHLLAQSGLQLLVKLQHVPGQTGGLLSAVVGRQQALRVFAAAFHQPPLLLAEFAAACAARRR